MTRITPLPALLGLLVLVSCGSSGGEETSAPSPASTEAAQEITTTSPPPTEVVATETDLSSTCGLTLLATSLRTYCGATGTPDGDGFILTGPDSPSVPTGVDIVNSAGTALIFGALYTNDVPVAYLLAEGSNEEVIVVDLIDRPEGSTDFSIDGSEVSLVDDSFTNLVTYHVIGRTLVVGPADVSVQPQDTSPSETVDAAEEGTGAGVDARSICPLLTDADFAELAPDMTGSTLDATEYTCSWTSPTGGSLSVSPHFPGGGDDDYIADQLNQTQETADQYPDNVIEIGDLGYAPYEAALSVFFNGSLLEFYYSGDGVAREILPKIAAVLMERL